MGARKDEVRTNRNGGYIETILPTGYDVLINGTSKYLNFNAVTGSSGYGLRDNAGTMEFKNSGGSWSSIGSGGGSGTVTSVASADGSITITNPTTTPDLTVVKATSGFTISGGDLAIGANNITITGSIGATGARVTKGRFTDLQVTNAIAGSITGNAATVTTNANLTGPITSSGNATSIASQTGTGTKFVMDTSPVLVTPNIGVATGTSLAIGTMGYTPSNPTVTQQGSTNSYLQQIIQNSSTGSAASADFVVNNSISTDTTNYGDFGMNSSGFTGSGALNQPSYVYLTSTSVDLAIGTTTSNGIHFVVNGGATDAMAISSGGSVSIASSLSQGFTTTATAAGTTTLTIASTHTQVFTGVTTQTVVLPTTAILAGAKYCIINNSTGLVTVQSSGLNTITILAAGTSAWFTAVVATPTTAANWNGQYLGLVSTSGKKLSVSNTLTLAGTDGTTMTFPTTSATIARTDAANTFTGVQTMTSPALTTPAITGLPTGTGVASAATASTLMSRDASVNTAINNIFQGFTTTATAAGTTTMTITSTYQQVWTGTTTQTIKLPTTSVPAGGQYQITNNSTGLITIQSSGANTIIVMPTGSTAWFTAVVATPTTAANRKYSYIESSSIENAITASANAATINLAFKTNTVTNNSAATLTITLPTAGSVAGKIALVKILDFSAAAQTITWVNTENSSVTAPTTSNGSTTLPLSALFQFNGATSKWRCIGYA